MCNSKIQDLLKVMMTYDNIVAAMIILIFVVLTMTLNSAHIC